MINKDKYLADMIGALREAFGERLLYVGLQGSYLRGEASESSDIDIMAVLDEVGSAELSKYREIITRIGDEDKSCGFICGRREMLAWNPLELCHLKNTTADCYGRLEPLLPKFTRADTASYIKLGAGNIYHALAHTRVHAARAQLAQLAPMALREMFFILQDLYFLETGEYIQTKALMREKLRPSDREVWDMLAVYDGDEGAALDALLDKVLAWCYDIMKRAQEA